MTAKSTVYVAISLHDRVAASTSQAYSGAPHEAKQRVISELIALLSALAGGNATGRLYVSSDDPSTGTAGTFTVTCDQASAQDGDLLVVAGVLFTAKTTASANPLDAQVAIGASDAAMGVNLKNALNNHPHVSACLVATDNGSGVVTCTFQDKGLFANLGAALETGGGFAVTQPSDGEEGVPYDYLRAYTFGV